MIYRLRKPAHRRLCPPRSPKWIFDYDNPPDYRSFLPSSICFHNFFSLNNRKRIIILFEEISERHSSSKSCENILTKYFTFHRISKIRKIETSLCPSQELTIKRCDRSFETRISLESFGIVEESWGSREQRAHEVERGG